MTQAEKDLKLVLFKIKRANIHLSNIACNGDEVSQQGAQEALDILRGAVQIGADRPSINGLHSFESQAVLP